MITFQAKYTTSATIGKFNKAKEVVPYKAAVVELNPDDVRDAFSLNFLSYFSLKKRGFSGAIYDNFLATKNGKINRNRVKYYALTKEQDSYKYIKSRNILGLVQISSVPIFNNSIYVDYLQTIKSRFFNKYNHVGTETLNFLKKTYPNKDIVLRAVANTVNFYKKNEFFETENGKRDGLVEMRYSCEQFSCP